MSDFPYLKIKHYINGAWKEETGVKTEPLYNPSTGEVIGEVPMASSELAKEAIAIADEAYKTWSKLPVAKRMTYIYKIRQGMVDNHENSPERSRTTKRNTYPKPAAKFSVSLKFWNPRLVFLQPFRANT